MVNMCDLRAQNTALHLCVQNGHLDTARLLLAKGAKPNLRNAAGRSALASAAAKNVDETVIALLIAHGAAGNVKTNFGETADQAKQTDPSSTPYVLVLITIRVYLYCTFFLCAPYFVCPFF